MPYLDAQKFKSATNGAKWTDLFEDPNEKSVIDTISDEYEAKNAKSAKKAVKTPILVDSEAKPDLQRYYNAYKLPKGAVSTVPDPNEAFKNKRRKKYNHCQEVRDILKKLDIPDNDYDIL